MGSFFLKGIIARGRRGRRGRCVSDGKENKKGVLTPGRESKALSPETGDGQALGSQGKEHISR